MRCPGARRIRKITAGREAELKHLNAAVEWKINGDFAHAAGAYVKLG